jgi:uncharacterized membrane protein YeiH
MIPNFWSKNKQIIIYGASLAVLLFLLKWLETRYILLDQQLDTYLGIVAVLFTALGIWLALKIQKPKVETVIVEKKVVLTIGPDFILNEEEVRRLNLSKRELEVVQ